MISHSHVCPKSSHCHQRHFAHVIVHIPHRAMETFSPGTSFLQGEGRGTVTYVTTCLAVNTTPKMTCFRGAKVCTKWLQGKVMMN